MLNKVYSDEFIVFSDFMPLLALRQILFFYLIWCCCCYCGYCCFRCYLDETRKKRAVNNCVFFMCIVEFFRYTTSCYTSYTQFEFEFEFVFIPYDHFIYVNKGWPKWNRLSLFSLQFQCEQGDTHIHFFRLAYFTYADFFLSLGFCFFSVCIRNIHIFIILWYY